MRLITFLASLFAPARELPPPTAQLGFIREHPGISPATQRKLLGTAVATTTWGPAKRTQETSCRGVAVVEWDRNMADDGDLDRGALWASKVQPEPGWRERRKAAGMTPPDPEEAPDAP